MQNKLLRFLRHYFKYKEFRSHQKDVINSILDGKHTLSIMPTGAGKSLCYQLPAIMQSGTAIVISPLIALMEDQVLSLKSKGINAETLHKGQNSNEQQKIISSLRNAELKILYLSPERVVSNYILNVLKTIHVSFFAIDEAHCVSEWGHDFRPEYLQVGKVVNSFNAPIVALTASATEQTIKDIQKQFNMQDTKPFKGSVDRKNIFYQVIKKSTNYKQELIDFIKKHHNQSGIIYTLSRKKTEEVAKFLNENNIASVAYHAGFSYEQRRDRQKFFTDNNIVMVATIAFGMGIDKPDVNFVIHLNLPKSLESYYQETGRAGRDNQPSQALLFFSKQDLKIIEFIQNKNFKNKNQKILDRKRLNAMLNFCEIKTCRRNFLLQYFDETSKHENCGNCDNCVAQKHD